MRGFVLETAAMWLAGLGTSLSGLKLEPAPCHQDSQLKKFGSVDSFRGCVDSFYKSE